MSKPPPVEFQPGMEVVPGYTLLSPLGSGMAGDVWQAQAAGGIRVALKVVRSLSDVGGRKELKALKTIRDVHHPNLCPLFGFWTKDADGRVLADGETEELTLDSSHLSQLPPGLSPKMSDSGGIGETMAVGPLDDTGSIEESQPAADLPTKSKVRAEQLIVVMGLGDCTLYDRLKYVRREAGIPHDDFKTPCGLDATETIRYLRSSASAIDLLNLEHDVYHFDIKPQNILLVGGEAQVCDFGLAKKIEADMRETQQTMATPAYASPEILEGKQLSRAEGETLYVDQYSLAVTYYELRTGLLPFDVTTHASMLVAKSTGKLDLEAIPPAERKVIQRAMRKKPKDRYGSCSEFINALAVAAGVDKAGGITTGRLLIAGAILLLGTGMGMAGWRYAAPDHFNSFFQLDKSAADLLAARRDDFQKLDSESFGESVRTLSTIAEDAASIAESSTDAIKSDALALYRDSIDRLLESTHQALEASESAGNIPEEKLPRFRNVVALLDIDSESPTESQQAVLLGQKQLSESSEQDRAASRRHRVLHDAARVRFNMLAKRATPSDVLDRIRDACEDGVEGTREQLGDSRLSPETLAVLPLLGSSSDDATELSFRQWLESQRLEDVLRAEAFQSLAGKPGPLASRWMSKRQAFLLAISPAVSGDRRDEVDDAVLGRLLGAFPDLLAESRLADLRSAVQDAKWENASDLLFQLESGNPSEDVRLQVGLLSEMVSNRQRENAVQLLRRYWESNRLDRETSERVRLSEPVTSYLNFIATRTIEQSPDVFSSLHLQIDDALWLSDRASMDLPDGYLEATLVSFLRLLGSDASKAIASPGDWDKFRRVADEIRDQVRSEAYRVAVDLEQQMFNKKRLPADVRLKSLTPLDSVSPAYPTFLALCSQASNQTSIGPLRDSITEMSATGVRSLGAARLVRGCDLLASAAVEMAGVDGDSLTGKRYSAATSAELARKAGTYLDTGRFLAEHLDSGPTDSLASELLIREAFAETRGAATSMLKPFSDFGRMENASNQLLLAIHHLSLERCRQKQPSYELVWDGLVRPTQQLISRFGAERFGAQKGESAEKRVLVEQVLLPSIRDGLKKVITQKEDSLLPTAIASDFRDRPDETLDFIEMVLEVYGDPLVKQGYQTPDDWRRDRMTLAATAAAATNRSEPSSTRRSEMLWRVVDAAVGLRELRGEVLIDLADKVEALGGSTAPVEYLRSVGLHRNSDEIDDAQQRVARLTEAFDRVMRSLRAIESSPIETELAKKHHYEVLSRSTDFAVQLAFLNSDVDRKLELLLPAVQRGEKALALYRDSWKETVNTVLLDAQISLANAHEDIAHYCSQGDDPKVAARRSENFRRSIDLFADVNSRNNFNPKTRYSLGRCRFRYASTLGPPERETVLRQAREAMGEAPGMVSSEFDDLNDLRFAAQWLIWKLQIENELKNSSDAVKMAEAALTFIADERVPVDYRNQLSVPSAKAFYSVKDIKNVKRSLKLMGDRGSFDGVTNRMKLLGDVAIYQSKPVDSELYTFAARTIASKSIPAVASRSEQAAEELSRMAIFAAAEYSRSVCGLERDSKVLLADLSAVISGFEDYVNGTNYRKLIRLSDILSEIESASANRAPERLIEPAIELASFIKDDTSYPNVIRQYVQVSVFNAFVWWRMEADIASRQNAMLKLMREQLGDSEKAAVTFVLREVAKRYPKAREAVPAILQAFDDI